MNSLMILSVTCDSNRRIFLIRVAIITLLTLLFTASNLKAQSCTAGDHHSDKGSAATYAVDWASINDYVLLEVPPVNEFQVAIADSAYMSSLMQKTKLCVSNINENVGADIMQDSPYYEAKVPEK
jgi:hypothetical protein